MKLEGWCIACTRSEESCFTHSRKPPAIQKMLFDEEGIVTTWQGIARFLKVYCETGSINRHPGSGRKTKASTEVRQIVEEQMRKDDETTAVQLHHLLETKGYKLSFSTILRCRKALGWTYRGSAYCQLIRDANKEKRAAWARQHIGDDFENVIWTDETAVQLGSHRQFACRKRGEPPRPKPRYPWTASVQYLHVYYLQYTHVLYMYCFFVMHELGDMKYLLYLQAKASNKGAHLGRDKPTRTNGNMYF